MGEAVLSTLVFRGSAEKLMMHTWLVFPVWIEFFDELARASEQGLPQLTGLRVVPRYPLIL